MALVWAQPKLFGVIAGLNLSASTLLTIWGPGLNLSASTCSTRLLDNFDKRQDQQWLLLPAAKTSRPVQSASHLYCSEETSTLNLGLSVKRRGLRRSVGLATLFALHETYGLAQPKPEACQNVGGKPTGVIVISLCAAWPQPTYFLGHMFWLYSKKMYGVGYQLVSN